MITITVLLNPRLLSIKEQYYSHFHDKLYLEKRMNTKCFFKSFDYAKKNIIYTHILKDNIKNTDRAHFPLDFF